MATLAVTGRSWVARSIALAGACVVTLLPASAAAEPDPPTRAAIVIGVDQTGSLPLLRAASSGARQMAAWLESEGFQVRTFVDEDRSQPVRPDAILAAVTELVELGTLEQLVVYFAGHGFCRGFSEFWLLSQASTNPNAAVSLIESVELARESGIPNVVFISDACRSHASSLKLARIHGSLIFPIQATTPPDASAVDLFLATRIGDSANEGLSAESGTFEGFYTAVFLDAFQHPDPEMVQVIEDQPVVPNRRLEGFLVRELRDRLRGRANVLRQNPESRVQSSEFVYIGRARVAASIDAATGSPALASGQDQTTSEPSIALKPFVLYDSSPAKRIAYQQMLDRAAIATREVLELSAATDFPAAAALVTGTAVRTVATERGLRAAPATRTDRGSALIPLAFDDGVRAGTVAVRFENGTGTAVAAFDGFVTLVTVGERGVEDVSYVPGAARPHRERFVRDVDELVQARTSNAVAARQGGIRIVGSRETREAAGRELTARLQMTDGADPAQGVYSAYACANAGLARDVQAVREQLARTLPADLFDVALLARERISTERLRERRVVPFCPMMSEGWNFLRVRRAELPDNVLAARDHLLPAVWTTFDAEGMRLIEQNLQIAAAEENRPRRPSRVRLPRQTTRAP